MKQNNNKQTVVVYYFAHDRRLFNVFLQFSVHAAFVGCIDYFKVIVHCTGITFNSNNYNYCFVDIE